MEILSEYKAKLDHCEVLCHRNTIIEDFISSWRKSLSEGKNLSGTSIYFLVLLFFLQ